MDRLRRLDHWITGGDSSTGSRIALIVELAIIAHLTVKVIRHISEFIINKIQTRKSRLGLESQRPKLITLIRLIVSAVTFSIYFLAIGFFLQELGIDLATYLKSASVIGLAISFGSQGLVQDMVIGLTLIFSDAMEVGDLVEVAGTTIVIGRVEEIGLRFTKLVNFFNQEVFVPNRTIANVSRFPLGGIYAYADVQIPQDADPVKTVEAIQNVARGMWMQFGAIILSKPVIDKVVSAEGGGWNYLRIHFKIWPGQGNLIETTFRQQVVNAMKTFNPNYAEWQVTVTYRTMTAAKGK